MVPNSCHIASVAAHPARSQGLCGSRSPRPIHEIEVYGLDVGRLYRRERVHRGATDVEHGIRQLAAHVDEAAVAVARAPPTFCR
jgi:hypothetical protein